MVGLGAVKSGQRDLWTQKIFRPLLQFGRSTRLPELPDVPMGRELAADPNALSLIEFAELPFFMALPFAGPPGMPADRAEALRRAFTAMCHDQAFIEEADRLGLDLSPIDADGVRKLLERSIATPKDVIARYNTLGAAKKN
jgi:hypothetical protein